MAIGTGFVLGMRILAFCAALAMVMTGHARAQDDRNASAKDRAAVADCLKLAVAAMKRRNGSQTGSDDTNAAARRQKIDPAAWLAELAAKKTEINRSSCIGVVSDPCLAAPENGSTISMAECMRRELRVWDERLNTAYKIWISECRNEEICEARRKMERAWIAYRDAMCILPRTEGGTIAIIEGSACMQGATARQAIWIEQENAEMEDK
jgi:uncharacterized protein YecT (DUF1311 family)